MAAFVLVLAAACGGGSSVDDVARVLAGSGDDAGRWEDVLRSANGGRSELSEKFAKQLTVSSGTVEAIRDASKDATDLACQAWTSGGSKVVANATSSPVAIGQAQGLLDRMHADTDSGSATIQVVTFACNVYGVANSGF